MNFEKVNLNVTYLCFHQVIVFQAYKNNSSSPIEAKYVFPLDDMAAGMFLSHKLLFLNISIITIYFT